MWVRAQGSHHLAGPSRDLFLPIVELVDGLHRDTSWQVCTRCTSLSFSSDWLLQDLKDFGREGGNVSFSDIDRDTPGRGLVEFHSPLEHKIDLP